MKTSTESLLDWIDEQITEVKKQKKACPGSIDRQYFEGKLMGLFLVKEKVKNRS